MGAGSGMMGEEGEESSSGTCRKDPWYWTTGWGLTEGGEGVWAGESKGGRNWDNRN